MMLVLENYNLEPEINLAFENELCNIGREIFMLWRNKPSVIAGKFTDIDSDVNLEYANDNNILIVRRNSGGGAVYHDLGNVNYTFIMKDDRKLTLEYFSRIIIKVLCNIGINAELEFSHNDIKADGAKISGTAQYHHEGIILHHGTLLFDVDLSIIPKVLKRSGQVANIRPMLKRAMNVEEFMQEVRSRINDSL